MNQTRKTIDFKLDLDMEQSEMLSKKTNGILKITEEQESKIASHHRGRLVRATTDIMLYSRCYSLPLYSRCFKYLTNDCNIRITDHRTERVV